VIGSSSGEIPNVIGDAGLVFQEADQNDLRDKLTMLIEDPELRQPLSKRGYKRAMSLYSWESIAGDTYETYRSVSKF